MVMGRMGVGIRVEGIKERERERANFVLTWVQRDWIAHDRWSR
jgi:hypothetical protein